MVLGTRLGARRVLGLEGLLQAEQRVQREVGRVQQDGEGARAEPIEEHAWVRVGVRGLGEGSGWGEGPGRGFGLG